MQHLELCGVLAMGRPSLPVGVKLVFWAGLRAGLTIAVAARASGGVPGNRASVAA